MAPRSRPAVASAPVAVAVSVPVAPPAPAPGATNLPKAPPPATGTLRLAVEPWAEVWVPPLTQLSLPAGAHQVQLRNGDLAPKDIAVDVPAGKYATVRHRF